MTCDPKMAVYDGTVFLLRYCQGPVFTRILNEWDEKDGLTPEEIRDIAFAMGAGKHQDRLSRLARHALFSDGDNASLMQQWREMVVAQAQHEASLTNRKPPEHTR